MGDARIVWIDTELTGLDPNTCYIIEVACLITDKNLDIISPPFSVVINQPKEVLDNMSEWCITHHAKSGLIKESLSSKITLKEAEEMLLEFLKQYVGWQSCPLAGNTIYMDRIFLWKYMPLIHDYLHYRIIDVSSVTELARRWNGMVYAGTKKKGCLHRALPDIQESIQELKYYKRYFFLTL